MSAHEHESLLSSSSSSSSSSLTSLPSPPSFTARDLNSFPCLPTSLVTDVWECMSGAWAAAHRRSPSAIRPLFTYCEEYELPGAFLVGGLIALVALPGWTVTIPAIESGIMRAALYCAFIVQLVAVYACLFLFRNIDPGFLPINDGPIDGDTARLLSEPQYLTTSLTATRPFEPVYTPAEAEAIRLKNEESERNGNFDHLNTYGMIEERLEQEWCRQCRIWRPPRAAHCYVCQQCVLRLDHHCGLLGNCTGIKNHRFFILFLMLIGSGAVTLAASALIWLVQSLILRGFSSEAVIALALLLVFALASCTSFIAYFHLYMMVMDVTMREKYGRKRTQYQAETMKPREKALEIWREIFLAPCQLKPTTRALQRKQQARREATTGGRAPAAAEDTRGLAIDVVADGTGDESNSRPHAMLPHSPDTAKQA